jgi:intergrase/recombinase
MKQVLQILTDSQRNRRETELADKQFANDIRRRTEHEHFDPKTLYVADKERFQKGMTPYGADVCIGRRNCVAMQLVLAIIAENAAEQNRLRESLQSYDDNLIEALGGRGIPP